MTSLSYISYFVILLCIYVTITTMATPAMDRENIKYEEYIIEHEISSTQAKNAALSTDINAIPAGCQECTKEERHYCTSSDLISDHCCCDRRFHEYFPYIPHTCYFGTQLCTTTALDCNKYTRLRTCCCDKYLLQKWKEKYGANDAVSTKNQSKIALILLMYLSLVYTFK